jgi:hypothetical protein
MPCPSHPPWLHHSNYTWRRVQLMKLLIMYNTFLQPPVTSSRFGPNILLNTGLMSENRNTEQIRRCWWNNGNTHPCSSSSMCRVNCESNARFAVKNITEKTVQTPSSHFCSVALLQSYITATSLPTFDTFGTLSMWQVSPVIKPISPEKFATDRYRVWKKKFFILVTNTSQEGPNSNEWGYYGNTLISFHIKIDIQSKKPVSKYNCFEYLHYARLSSPVQAFAFFFQWFFQPTQGPGLLFSSVIIFHRR